MREALRDSLCLLCRHREIDDQYEGDAHRAHGDKEGNQAARRLGVGKLQQQGLVDVAGQLKT